MCVKCCLGVNWIDLYYSVKPTWFSKLWKIDRCFYFTYANFSVLGFKSIPRFIALVFHMKLLGSSNAWAKVTAHSRMKVKESFPYSTVSISVRCQLLSEEYALNTDKLLGCVLPRNILKVTECPLMPLVVNPGHKLSTQANKLKCGRQWQLLFYCSSRPYILMIWAVMRENRSLGVPTRSDTNRPVHL